MVFDLDIPSRLGDIAKENHVSPKNIKEMFIDELYKLSIKKSS